LNKYKAILEEARKDFGINDDFKIIMNKDEGEGGLYFI
jgi:hypothetical protein